MLFGVPMKLRLPGDHRPMSPDARAGLGAAFVLLALISAVEVADGPDPHYIGLLACAPFLVATFAAWREVVLVGATAVAIGLTFGFFPHGLTVATMPVVNASARSTSITR